MVIQLIYTLMICLNGSLWEDTLSVDPITDDTIRVISSSAISGYSTNAPILFVRVLNSDYDYIEVGIYWGTYLSENDTECIIRVDDYEPISASIYPDTRTNSTIFRTSVSGILSIWELFGQLLIGNELFVRFGPRETYPMTVCFSLEGITAAAQKVSIAEIFEVKEIARNNYAN